MRFSLALIATAFASLVAAQNPNSFDIPASGNYLLTAGKPQTFNWSNKEGSTVTLVLTTGDRANLKNVSTIASNIPNSGTYTWNVPSSTVEGANYAVKIIDDDDTSVVNFTGQFVIQSSVKAGASSSASSSASASSGASSSTASNASASASASASSASASASASASDSATAKASKTSASSSTSTGASTVPTNNSAPMVKVGGSLLAVALGFAVAL